MGWIFIRFEFGNGRRGKREKDWIWVLLGSIGLGRKEERVWVQFKRR